MKDLEKIEQLILNEFPSFFKERLSCWELDQDYKSIRFEEFLLQPYLWAFLKEKTVNVVREFPYQFQKSKNKIKLDIAILNSTCDLDCAMQLKAMPIKSSKTGYLKNYVAEIGKDILDLLQLKEEKDIKCLNIVMVSSSDEFNLNGKPLNEQLNLILYVALLSKILYDIINIIKEKENENEILKKLKSPTAPLWEVLKTKKTNEDFLSLLNKFLDFKSFWEFYSKILKDAKSFSSVEKYFQKNEKKIKELIKRNQK